VIFFYAERKTLNAERTAQNTENTLNTKRATQNIRLLLNAKCRSRTKTQSQKCRTLNAERETPNTQKRKRLTLYSALSVSH
jgi:hypothetical protein